MDVEASEFTRLLCAGTPLIDVRAPVEFNKGTLPHAVNLPILNDDERRRVGICYKEHGPETATRLGHRIVSGKTRTERIAQWTTFRNRFADVCLYCARGGQRSTIAADWMREQGAPVRRIVGGFKALRRHLLDATERLASGPLLIVGGQTGCGKTALLGQIEHGLDLEGHANHRGSAFGRRLTPQPSQVMFENTLAIAYLRLELAGLQGRCPVFEDESHTIGAIALPPHLFSAMKRARLVLIEADADERAWHIYDEYVVQQRAEFVAAHGDGGVDAFADYLLNSLDAISKRLGGERHARIRSLMTAAIANHERTPERHLAWISALLADYYDGMYDYQIERKSERIAFRGSFDDVLAWVRTYRPSAMD
jgi:tRNA 2-selenouridine synthase